jgi:hypothetical protein
MSVKFNFSGFFDRKAVLKAVNAADRKILNEVGRKVRSTAQKSIKYADGPSAPGSAPHGHKTRQITRKSKKTGKSRTRNVSYLREFLYYKYDFATRSVVVGPERLDSTVDPSALRALEEGGVSRVSAPGGKTRSVQIRKRPYMKPALDSNLPDFTRMWHNSVRST